MRRRPAPAPPHIARRPRDGPELPRPRGAVVHCFQQSQRTQRATEKSLEQAVLCGPLRPLRFKLLKRYGSSSRETRSRESKANRIERSTALSAVSALSLFNALAERRAPSAATPPAAASCR